MSERDEQVVRKILMEITILREMLGDISEADFLQDERTMRAACMTLINIGELVKNLTAEFKQAYPAIPWRPIAGMRDVTAHKYQTLLRGDVYRTCIHDIPILERQLSEIFRA